MAAQGQGANDLAFLGWDGLAFWRATGTEVRSRGHLNLKGISSVAWMAGGKQIAVGFKDGTVHFWDLQYGFQLKSLQAHTKTVQALACEPSGKWVATIGPDGDLKVWKVSKA
jgi:WD40 repeat protein